MRTDRELLELAAKAAGAEMTDYSDRTPDHWIIKRAPGSWVPWDPLGDDGDALRLAVSRSILRCHMDLFHDFYDEELAQDRRPSEATRRAIVRVAAETSAQVHPDNKDGGAAYG